MEGLGATDELNLLRKAAVSCATVVQSRQDTHGPSDYFILERNLIVSPAIMKLP
jgi:hypothetical protein